MNTHPPPAANPPLAADPAPGSTSARAAGLPPVAILLGAAGVLPFLAFALACLSASGATAMLYLSWLIGYGAVILAFLGAVHWGLVLAAGEPGRAAMRLALGVLPALAGWVALGLQGAGIPSLALALLIASFLAVIATERNYAAKGWLPAGYLWLRYALTLAVVLILATVLTLRLLGARIVL